MINKGIRFIIFFIFIFTSTSIFSQETIDISIRGKKYKFLKEGLSYYSGSYVGEILFARPAKNLIIKIGRNKINFAAAKEISFFSSEISPRASGRIGVGTLATDSLLSVGNRRLLFRGGTEIAFYASGVIEHGYLAKDTKFTIRQNTVVLKKGTDESDQIKFYDSGKIKQGYLLEKKILHIGKNSYLFTGQIGFYESGKVEWGTLANDTVIKIGKNNLKFSGGQEQTIEFYESGSLQRACLSDVSSFQIGKTKIKFQYNIDFLPDGRVKQGTLAEDFQISGGNYNSSQTVFIVYDDAGNLKGLRLYQNPQR